MNEIFVVFSERALGVFGQAGQAFADNDVIAVMGITEKMESIISMVNDPTFIVESDGDTISKHFHLICIIYKILFNEQFFDFFSGSIIFSWWF